VGNAKNEFQVHEDLLCEISPFFSAAFTSEFKEGAEKVMTLCEDNTEIFDVFVQRLYHQQYEIPASEIHCQRGGHMVQSMQLYVLAEKFGISKRKKHIVDALILQVPKKHLPALVGVAHVYENTPLSSGMRDSIANWYACRAQRPWFEETRTHNWLQGEPAFAADLVASLARLDTPSQRTNRFKDPSEAAKYYNDREGLGA